jgi:hypothetical protein
LNTAAQALQKHTHGPAEHRDRTAPNPHDFILTHDVHIVEGRCKQADQQADAASDVNARRVSDDPANGELGQRRIVDDQG